MKGVDRSIDDKDKKVLMQKQDPDTANRSIINMSPKGRKQSCSPTSPNAIPASIS